MEHFDQYIAPLVDQIKDMRVKKCPTVLVGHERQPRYQTLDAIH